MLHGKYTGKVCQAITPLFKARPIEMLVVLSTAAFEGFHVNV